MNFAHALFSFEGRLRRRDFWIGTLIIWGISWVVLIAAVAVSWETFMLVAQDPEGWEAQAEADPSAALHGMGPLLIGFGILFIWEVAIIWPSLALCAKRLHDRNQSAWWVLLFVGDHVLRIVPIVGLLSWLAFKIYWLVNLGILEGTIGPNQYGPDPRNPDAPEAVA